MPIKIATSTHAGNDGNPLSPRLAGKSGGTRPAPTGGLLAIQSESQAFRASARLEKLVERCFVGFKSTFPQGFVQTGATCIRDDRFVENNFISEKTFKNFLVGMNAKLKIIHRGNYDSSDFAWMVSLNEHAIAKKLYAEGIREIDNTWRSRFCRFKKSTKMIKESLKNLINPPTVSENFEF